MSDGLRRRHIPGEDEKVSEDVAKVLERAGDKFEDYVPPIRFIYLLGKEKEKKAFWRALAIAAIITLTAHYALLLAYLFVSKL